MSGFTLPPRPEPRWQVILGGVVVGTVFAILLFLGV